MFAHCVDAKSPYTAEHSRGVSRLARALAAWAGLPEGEGQRLELAGLLHDLGKLRVPDEILDKPAPLNDEELAVMERHSFDSGLILGGIRGLEDVAAWAAEHHEAPDGRGYPYRHEDGALGIHSRILAVADVFQALAQDRPYRPSVSPRGILRVLDEGVEGDKLDAGVVALVRGNLAECWDLAHEREPIEPPRPAPERPDA
jgi:HD-GYP domain-containing protein (c-di-GMP phosphodiesterase class II)